MTVVARAPITVWFDDDCGLCSSVVRRLRARVDGGVTWRPDRDLPGGPGEAIVVTREVDGVVERVEGAPAVAVVLGRCGALLRLVGRAIDLPGMRWCAARVYRWVAANRARISARLGLPSGCALAPLDRSPESNA